jgi:hypothetical protein
MRKYGFVVFVLLLVSLGAGVRDAAALPTSQISDSFQDCALFEVGWRIVTCGGVIYKDGDQVADFRLREWERCDTGAYSYQWYAWNGSGWTPISGTPQPTC